MIYLDYASNYPAKKEVLDEFYKVESSFIGNYNSNHLEGKRTKEEFIKYDNKIKKILNLNDDYEIIYTSSATESNNLAIKGIIKSYSGFGKKILVSEIEHSSVNGTLGKLKDAGYQIEFIKTLNTGEIDFDDLKNKLTSDVILVICILVDSETGFIHNYKKINEIVKNNSSSHLLIDATQGVGKFNIDFNELELVSFAPHKFGGLIGTGCLIKKKTTILTPLIEGGESNSIYRSGTPSLGLLSSIYKSLEIAYLKMEDNYNYVKNINEYFLNNIKNLKGLLINSFSNPYIINISLINIPSYKVIEYFNSKEICISQKSACSIKNTPSKIIYSIYKDKKRASTSFRISLSELVKKEEIDEVIKCIKELINER